MIIGQTHISKDIQKIFAVFRDTKCAIRPHFFLTGKSGSGKSYIVQTLAKGFGFNVININAAALTKEGTSGNSVSKALTPLINNNGKPTVIFVDEFDKLFISGNNAELAHQTTVGVQNEFLTILESPTTQVYGDYGKYVTVKTDNLLFVFAGAFNGQELGYDELYTIGVKTEFLGRVCLLYRTEEITFDDYLEALEKSPLLDSYLIHFKMDKTHVVKELYKLLGDQYEDNLIGMRLINRIIHQYFIESRS